MLPPWKLRGPDTGSEKSLRASQSIGRTLKEPFKMGSVSGNAVRGRALEAGPDEFGRIKFRGVRREAKRSDSPIGPDKALDTARLVDGASVPEKNESTFKVPEKMLEESHGLGSSDVPLDIKANVESKMFSSRGEAERRDRRDLRPASGHSKDRSLAPYTPGLSDRGDKREAALVEENDRDLKLSGLFLYAARYGASTAAPVLSLSPWLAFLASGSSNPLPLALSRRALSDTGLRNASGSLGRFGARSKVPLNSRSLEPRSRELLPTTFSGARLASEDVRGPAWIPTHPVLLSFALRSNGVWRRLNNPVSLLYLPALLLDLEARWLAGAAAPAPFGFHGVSLSQYIIDTLLLRESIVSSYLSFYKKLHLIIFGGLLNYLPHNFHLESSCSFFPKHMSRLAPLYNFSH
jgi:hypothetical protein